MPLVAVIPQLRLVVEALAAVRASVPPDVFVNPGNVVDRLLLRLEFLSADGTLEGPI